MSEVRHYLAMLNIDELVIQPYRKKNFKQYLRKIILLKNRTDILNRIKNYQKLDYNMLRDEDFKIKSYLKTMHIKDS